MGEKRIINRHLWWKSDRKRPLGRRGHKEKNIMKMILQKVGCVGMDWIDLDRVVSKVGHL